MTRHRAAVAVLQVKQPSHDENEEFGPFKEVELTEYEDQSSIQQSHNDKIEEVVENRPSHTSDEFKKNLRYLESNEMVTKVVGGTQKIDILVEDASVKRIKQNINNRLQNNQQDNILTPALLCNTNNQNSDFMKVDLGENKIIYHQVLVNSHENQ